MLNIVKESTLEAYSETPVLPTNRSNGVNIEGTADLTAPAMPHDPQVAPPSPEMPAETPVDEPYSAPPHTQYTRPPGHVWGV